MTPNTDQRYRFLVEFDQEPMTNDDVLNHMMQMVRWAGTSVRIHLVSTDSVIVDRERFERLRAAASYAERTNWKLADLAPGDLDPIP